MGKRELVALLTLSSLCLVIVERLFLVVPWGFLRFVIVVFPDHIHLLLLCSFACGCEGDSDLCENTVTLANHDEENMSDYFSDSDDK